MLVVVLSRRASDDRLLSSSLISTQSHLDAVISCTISSYHDAGCLTAACRPAPADSGEPAGGAPPALAAAGLPVAVRPAPRRGRVGRRRAVQRRHHLPAAGQHRDGPPCDAAGVWLRCIAATLCIHIVASLCTQVGTSAQHRDGSPRHAAEAAVRGQALHHRQQVRSPPQSSGGPRFATSMLSRSP